MDFSQGAGQQSGNDLIPNGQLAWAYIEVRGLKPSSSGGQYLDIELTLDDGQPFGRRKIWEMIGDPMHRGNGDTYRQMGQVAIARILEAGRGAGPNNPQAYHLADNGQYRELSGLRVPIKIKIEKGRDGYDDKNKVAEWLTPNPASGSGYKDYEKLKQGITNTSQKPEQSPAPSGFGSAPAPQQSQPQQGFGNASQQGGGNVQGNFSPAQPQGTQWGNQGTASNEQLAPSTLTTKSPSSGEPNWLAQANGR